METPVTQSQISELYKTLLEQENSHTTVFISILFGIVVILLGITWWWNKEGANRFIRQSVNKKMKEQIVSINSKIATTVEEKVKEKLEAYEDRVLLIEVDLYRAFAFTIQSYNNNSHAVYYFSICLAKVIQRNDGALIRAMTEQLLEISTTMKTANENKIHSIDEVKQNVNLIPNTLHEERKKILDFLQTCENV